MGLLTPQDEQQIREGFKAVLDTFSNTPIVIRVTNDISLQPVQEGRSDLQYTEYNFVAYVEYNNGTANKEDANFGGVWDNSDVRAFVHLDYVEAAGLMVNDYPNISPNSSRLVVDNDGRKEVYRITHISVDGALGKRQIFMMVRGQREELQQLL